MCLILFAWRSHSHHPLVVAANRDEFYARRAAPLHAWSETPHIFAGKDLEQGGTWLGVTRHGRFAALTNVRQPNAALGTRSRGHLVRDFLTSQLQPAAFIDDLQQSLNEYSPFNLLLGDGQALYYCNNTGESRSLAPGIYGLSNAALDTPWPKVTQGKRGLQTLLQDKELNPEALLNLLSDRQPAPAADLPDTGVGQALETLLSPRFIHADTYGTRCSTVLLQDTHCEYTLYERTFDANGNSSDTIHLRAI
ncbi:MAG: NRDE family protein [Pseudomonadales bacterium]|nr:NRDE family protein [Pseudomonadales bacterium]